MDNNALALFLSTTLLISYISLITIFHCSFRFKSSNNTQL